MCCWVCRAMLKACGLLFSYLVGLARNNRRAMMNRSEYGWYSSEDIKSILDCMCNKSTCLACKTLSNVNAYWKEPFAEVANACMASN